MNDEDLYLEATNEVEGETKSPSLWAKVMALSEGDEVKAKYKYIKIRVEQLKSHQEASQELKVEGTDSEAFSVVSDPEKGKEDDAWIPSRREQIENDDAPQNENISEPIIFLAKIASGYFGLAKTFWVYGFMVRVVASVLLNIITSTTGFVIFFIVYSVYETLVLMGIWNASDNYKGLAIWAVLAKVTVVLGAIMLAVGFFVTLVLRPYA